MSFRDNVISHYRGRGYEVRESVKVRGNSGSVYAVDLVAQSELGNLVITFGGLDGVDETDLAQIKRIAKDCKAAAVAASEEFEPEIRRHAERQGVILLDGNLPAEEAPPAVALEDDYKLAAEAHPWPQTGVAVDPAKTAAQATGLDDVLGKDEPVKQVVFKETVPEPEKPVEKFAWLKPESDAAYEFQDATPAPRREETVPVAQAVDELTAKHERPPKQERPAKQPRSHPGEPGMFAGDNLVWLVRFVIAGVVAALVLWALLTFGPQ